uniref:Uncharacterized protein n=1 Tax=Aegilops tauschii subsp. strangulata TaxID=200361 RepID=A0A453L062_AEGTS
QISRRPGSRIHSLPTLRPISSPPNPIHPFLLPSSLLADESAGELSRRSGGGMGEFDDYWARAYRGDPAVPHSDPQRLISTWTGAFALGAAACVHHHVSGLASNIKSLPHRAGKT